jgi:hypothetical protein
MYVFFFLSLVFLFFTLSITRKSTSKGGQNVIIADNVMSKNMNRGEENIGHLMEQCHE